MLSCSSRQDGGDYALHDDYRKNTEHSEILCIGNRSRIRNKNKERKEEIWKFELRLGGSVAGSTTSSGF